MSVRLDLTQSIRVLFHYRRSPHSTFFSRGRTLGPAVFNAPYSRNRARPSLKGLSVNHSFFLLRTGISPCRSLDDFIKIPGLLRKNKPNTRSQIRVKKKKTFDHYTNPAFLNYLEAQCRQLDICLKTTTNYQLF